MFWPLSVSLSNLSHGYSSRSYKNGRDLMTKAKSILRTGAIILNPLLAIFLTVWMIHDKASGSIRFIFLAAVFCSILNVILLALSKRLLTGGTGTFFLYLSSALNLYSLHCVLTLTVTMQWGLPRAIIPAATVIMWFACPVITLPAIFLVRGRLNKSDDSDQAEIKKSDNFSREK